MEEGVVVQVAGVVVAVVGEVLVEVGGEGLPVAVVVDLQADVDHSEGEAGAVSRQVVEDEVVNRCLYVLVG